MIMAKKTLADLRDAFKEEPLKNVKIDGVKKKVPKWNMDSRNLMINLFFNILKEKHRTAAGKLPSINADALDKMKNPIAQEVIKFRSDTNLLNSFKNVGSYVHSNRKYGYSDEWDRANIKYNMVGFDNVERIYPVAKESIPLSANKKVRKAFVIPRSHLIFEDYLKDDIRKILDNLKE